MTKIYDILSDELTREFTWRLREIHRLRTAIADAEELCQESVTRAAFVLLYAHWEGFVKRSAELFLTYLARMNKPVSKLHDGAMIVCLRKEILHVMTYKNGSNRQIKAMIDAVSSGAAKKLSRRHAEQPIRSANMNFDEFADVCMVFGIEPVEFDEHRDLIHRILVNRRHQIAHGANLRVDYGDFLSTSDNVIAVMRMLRNKVENSFMDITTSA